MRHRDWSYIKSFIRMAALLSLIGAEFLGIWEERGE